MATRKLSGSVSEVSPGLWRVRMSLGRDPGTGNPRQAERRVHGSEDDALRCLAELHLDRESRRAGARAEVGTVAELVDRYVTHLEYLGREELTLRGYRAQAKVIATRLGKVRLGKLRPADLEEFYRWLIAGGRSATTAKRYHALISGALNYAETNEWVASNVAKRASLPRPERFRPANPSVADVLAVLDLVPDVETRFGLWLALATGCRRGEVCGLRWSDLDGSRLHVRRSVAAVDGRIVVKATKTHADRVVGLDAGTVAAISDARARAAGWADDCGVGLSDDGFMIFDPSDPGGLHPRHPDSLTSAWVTARKAAGVDGRLHDLRHLQASLLLAEGLPVKDVADRLGHASATTTMNIYAHVLAGRDQMAADIIGAKLRRS